MNVETARAISEDFALFCAVYGVTLYPWQVEAFGAAFRREGGRFCARLAGVSAPRGNGKSFAGAAGGLWRLLFGPPPQTILSVGLLVEGAKIILEHGRRLVRARPELGAGVEERADGFVIPATGSRWIVRSRDHESSRGEHPDLITYDECAWAADDSLFASLLSAQASVVDPLMLVVSTVGKKRSGPLWQVKTLGEAGEPEVLWWHSSENGSPRITAAFLERQRRLLLPAQFAREHQNQWVDQADSFVTQADVDWAMGQGWAKQAEGQDGRRYEIAVDIGAVHDPTVIGVGHRGEDGRLYIDTLVTLQGSRETPVQMSAIEQTVRDLAEVFVPEKIRIESWQGLATAQALTRLGLPVEVYTPTAKSHAEEWPQLAQALMAKRLVVPPHARLREELLGLTVEATATGMRVTDRGEIHQDHAVVCRMLVARLARPAPAVLFWGGGPLGPDPRSVEEIQRAEDEDVRVRHEVAAAQMAETLKANHGIYWPGDVPTGLGRGAQW
jgi:hypothetical protein